MSLLKNLKENEPSVTEVSTDELSDLQAVCKEVYSTYFGDYWERDGLEHYLEEQFGTERLRNDLQDENIGYYFIRDYATVAGFMKMNYQAELPGDNNRSTCELEKMYVLPEYKSKGIGRVALNTVINLAHQRGENSIFLGVLQSNKAGRRFYESAGFEFHSQIRLPYEDFKEEFKGLDIMYLQLE